MRRIIDMQCDCCNRRFPHDELIDCWDNDYEDETSVCNECYSDTYMDDDSKRFN